MLFFFRSVSCMQVETFEEGFVVSDYAKLFADKANRKLNGNPGIWEWAQLKMLGRPTGTVGYQNTLFLLPMRPKQSVSWK